MKKVIRGIGIDVGFTRENPSGWMVVDFAESNGWKPDIVAHGTVKPMSIKPEWTIRVASVAEGVMDNALVYGDFDFVAFEMPFVHKGTQDFQTALKLAACGGAFLHAFYGTTEHMTEVNTMQVKKALSKNGKASKQEMIASAKKLTGLDLQAHEADALGVALAGVFLTGLLKAEDVP